MAKHPELRFGLRFSIMGDPIFYESKVISIATGASVYNPKSFLSLGTIFQQDNACPHVAQTAGGFFSAHDMQVLPWAAYSPAMSPIEHVWDLVGRRLDRDQLPATSKEELWLRMRAIWNSLPQADIKKTVWLHAASYNSTYCSAWWLHQILFSDTFFSLKILSVIFTNTSHLYINFHLILIIPSGRYIFYKQQYIRNYFQFFNSQWKLQSHSRNLIWRYEQNSFVVVWFFNFSRGSHSYLKMCVAAITEFFFLKLTI